MEMQVASAVYPCLSCFYFTIFPLRICTPNGTAGTVSSMMGHDVLRAAARSETRLRKRRILSFFFINPDEAHPANATFGGMA
jgi:hypothetical protein